MYCQGKGWDEQQHCRKETIQGAAGVLGYHFMCAACKGWDQLGAQKAAKQRGKGLQQRQMHNTIKALKGPRVSYCGAEYCLADKSRMDGVGCNAPFPRCSGEHS